MSAGELSDVRSLGRATRPTAAPPAITLRYLTTLATYECDRMAEGGVASLNYERFALALDPHAALWVSSAEGVLHRPPVLVGAVVVAHGFPS